ncbi:MAG TPA: type II secretion system F family protein, partial [Planctomycetota bacterium]|nr:type II secretion system F family protein [Planctomycetota bacterium]
MTQFSYTAREPSGRTVAGVIDAPNREEAANQLRRRTLIPTEIRQAAAVAEKRVRSTCKKGEVELFTRQLATMISAGIPVLECLEVLQEQAESRGFKSCLATVVEDIRSGSDMSAALGKHPKVFSEIYCSMVKAGEASGQLSEILERLADYLEATQHLKREIKSAMTYPVISLVLVFGIAGFLMIGIVPKFKEIFDGLGVPLPGVTKAVMGASMWMKANVLLIFAGMIGAGFGFSAFKKTKRGTRLWDRFILKVPVFGSLFRKVALSRFSRTFSTLVKSGVPIVGALEIVAETAGNTVIEEAVRNASESVKTGDTLSGPLGKEPVFPPMVV